MYFVYTESYNDRDGETRKSMHMFNTLAEAMDFYASVVLGNDLTRIGKFFSPEITLTIDCENAVTERKL